MLCVAAEFFEQKINKLDNKVHTKTRAEKGWAGYKNKTQDLIYK